MGQPTNAPPPYGSVGARLRAFRHRACLSQEQLAARAELSERTVRNLEAGRVRSPRNETVRLLADALALTGPERQSWVAAAQGANGRQAEAGLPGADGAARLPRPGERHCARRGYFVVRPDPRQLRSWPFLSAGNRGAPWARRAFGAAAPPRPAPPPRPPPDPRKRASA